VSLVPHSLLLSCSDDVSFSVADSSLQHLHTLCALLERVSALKPAATLRIALLPSIALEQTCASLLLRPTALQPSACAPIPQPLVWAGKRTRVLLAYCSSMEKALALPNIRALFIPSVSEYLGEVATREQQVSLVSKLLQPMPRAQLFPPLSWQELTCRKEAVYATFTDKFMLHTEWIALPDKQSLPVVAEKIREHCGRSGKWVLKGNFSACSQAVFSATFSANQRCAELLSTLDDLFFAYHQRCVGVQRYQQSLRDHEMRVYLIPDEQHHLRWRQTVSLSTAAYSDDGCCHFAEGSTFKAEMQLPLHGKPLRIARFIDRLLAERADFFLRAEQLRVPLLRLDCGFNEQDQPFLNELVCAVNCCCYSGVHSQDLAYVVGQGLAEGMMTAMQA
jgi:hypothetical protein